MNPEPRELTLQLPHLQLAAREWGAADGMPVLALHGWLDNAASFDRLAPLLPELHLVALDLPGHGHSDHRPAGARLHFIDWIPDVMAAADALQWRRFSILGHSLGAGIAPLVAAVFAERIDRLVLIDATGPLSASPDDAPQMLARALRGEQRLAGDSSRTRPNLEAAINARMAGTGLDREAAALLVRRATESTADGVRFCHDPRLKSRSPLYLTEPQVLAFLRAVTCPVLVIKARDGWPYPEELVAARLAALRDLRRVELPGGHHLHLTDPAAVARLVRPFLLDERVETPR